MVRTSAEYLMVVYQHLSLTVKSLVMIFTAEYLMVVYQFCGYQCSLVKTVTEVADGRRLQRTVNRQLIICFTALMYNQSNLSCVQ